MRTVLFLRSAIDGVDCTRNLEQLRQGLFESPEQNEIREIKNMHIEDVSWLSAVNSRTRKVKVLRKESHRLTSAGGTRLTKASGIGSWKSVNTNKVKRLCWICQIS